MKSWTLIPFYLWKNTCRRWLEYPVSPVSKILIPTLLGFLAIIVLTLFAEIERELREQLSRNSVYTVVVSEFVGSDSAPTILRRSIEEELLWSGHYGEDTIKQVRQPLVSASLGRHKSVPLLAYTASVTDFRQLLDPTEPPSVSLLSDDASLAGQSKVITMGRVTTVATVRPVPKWVSRDMGLETAVAVPVEMVQIPLNKGFINHMVASLDSIEEVERFVGDVSSYYRAEKRQVKILSALAILKNLERITGIQKIVKTLIVVGCGIILALTLGSIAWLEYRQDSYLLALLKSFGTPSVVLLLHMFFENLLLVFSGIMIVSLGWPSLYSMAVPKLQAIGLMAATLPAIPSSDVSIILIAGLVGVVLAMVPVAFSLRKPAGLILQ